MKKLAILYAPAYIFTCLIACQEQPKTRQIATSQRYPFLDTLQVRTLNYFLEDTDPATGLTPDRWPGNAPASIAAIGFGLTSYAIAAERGLITRTEAADRTLSTLRFLYNLPQSGEPQGIAGYKGFFYHFLDRKTGHRTWDCELSTIDTALLMAGILFCQSYFSTENETEQSIAQLADSLYQRVDWMWFTDNRKGLVTGWRPERGFSDYVWQGYNEALILYILALGSPNHPLPDWYMHTWYSTYKWDSYQGSNTSHSDRSSVISFRIAGSTFAVFLIVICWGEASTTLRTLGVPLMSNALTQLPIRKAIEIIRRISGDLPPVTDLGTRCWRLMVKCVDFGAIGLVKSPHRGWMKMVLSPQLLRLVLSLLLRKFVSQL